MQKHINLLKIERMQIKEQLDRLEKLMRSKRYAAMEGRSQGLIVANYRALKRVQNILRIRLQEAQATYKKQVKDTDHVAVQKTHSTYERCLAECRKDGR